MVDYFPPKLEHFTRSLNDASFTDGITSSVDTDEMDLTFDSEVQAKEWEWAFYLLVEDANLPSNEEASKRMKLLVAGDVAERLLKMDAVEYVI